MRHHAKKKNRPRHVRDPFGNNTAIPDASGALVAFGGSGRNYSRVQRRSACAPGMGDMGFSFKKFGRGLARVGRVGLAVGTGGASELALNKKLRKGIGRAALFGAKYGTAPGLAFTVGKALFGKKKPKRIRMPNGSVVKPEEDSAETGIPEDAITDAATAANQAGDDPDARAEAVDQVEKDYGLDEDALTPIADATGDDAGGEEMGSIFSAIGKGFKAVGKGAKAVGKVAVKGAGGAIATAGKGFLSQYGINIGGGGGGGQPDRPGGLGLSTPVLIGGAVAVAGVIFLATRRGGSSAPAA